MVKIRTGVKYGKRERMYMYRVRKDTNVNRHITTTFVNKNRYEDDFVWKFIEYD